MFLDWLLNAEIPKNHLNFCYLHECSMANNEDFAQAKVTMCKIWSQVMLMSLNIYFKIICVCICWIVIQDERLVWLVSSWRLEAERLRFGSEVYVWYRCEVLEWNWKVYIEWIWRESTVWSSITWPERDRMAASAVHRAVLWLWPSGSLDHQCRLTNCRPSSPLSWLVSSSSWNVS